MEDLSNPISTRTRKHYSAAFATTLVSIDQAVIIGTKLTTGSVLRIPMYILHVKGDSEARF